MTRSNIWVNRLNIWSKKFPADWPDKNNKYFGNKNIKPGLNW